MKKKLLTFYLALTSFLPLIFGQQPNSFQLLKDVELPTPSSIESTTATPKWVDYMYENPTDLVGITSKYEAYYENNALVKNQHTQFYKRLVRTHSRIPYQAQMTTSALQNFNQKYTKERAEFIQKNSNQWTSVGPTDIDLDATVSGATPGTAHVNALGFCFGAEQHILAATATAGVWKSSDNGESWHAVTSDLPVAGVFDVAFRPHSPNELYFSAGASFYKSIDGGVSWYIAGGESIAQNTVVYEILPNPLKENEIFIASNKGVHVSTDNGESFTKTFSGKVTEIELHPTNGSILYAIKSSGNQTLFYKSEDGGLTFQHFQEGYPAPSAVEEQKKTVLSVTASEPDAIFALAVGKMNNGDGLVGIYKSENQGENWSRKCCGDTDGGLASLQNPNIMEWNCEGTQNGGQYYYDLAIAVHPENSNHLITGGINLWQSLDGGNQMECLSEYIRSNNPETYVHADIHDIQFVNGAIWVASDGGIFRSMDNASSFQKRMNGIHATDFKAFDLSFYDKDIMLGGTYHNGTMLKEGNTYIDGWVSTRSGDNARASINRGNSTLIYDHAGTRKLTGDRLVAPKNSNLSKKPNASMILGESSEIVFDPHCYTSFYVGNGGSLYKTDNNGISFEELEDFGSGKVTAIEVSTINPDLIYLVYYPGFSAMKQIKRSMDGGQTWTDITIPPSLYNNQDTWITYDIAVGSSKPLYIWAVRIPSTTSNLDLSGNSVFFSANAGETWENITPSEMDDEFPTNIVHHEGTEDRIYIGTRRTVFTHAGSQWEMLASGLPAHTFSTRIIPHYQSGKLINATHRGVFETELTQAGGAAVPMVNVHHSSCLRDTFYFMDRSPVESNYTRLWTFEGSDIGTSTEVFPKVTYAEAGTYAVKLEIFTSEGDYVFESSDFITVEDGCAIEPTAGNSLTTGNSAYAKVVPFNKSLSTFTVSAWVKRYGPIYNEAGVVVHRDGTNGTGLFINSSGYLTSSWDELQSSVISDLYVPYNKWAYIAMTVSNEGITLYVNEQSAFFSKDISTIDFEDHFLIGSDEFAISNYLTGVIDEVKFYDRALTYEEIQQNMHLTSTEGEEGLFAYYQVNNEDGLLTDRTGSNHAHLISNASRTFSMAPIGGGCSDRLEIFGPGTYNFECAGIELTFEEGDITPQGPLSITKLDELPGLPLPESNQISNGYWVMNNYGFNQSISAPKNVSISGFMDGIEIYQEHPEFFELYKVPTYWEYGWGGSVDEADSLTLENDGTITFQTLNALSSSGKFIVAENGNVSLSAWEVLLNAEFSQDYIELDWSGLAHYERYELLKSTNGKDFHVLVQGEANSHVARFEDFDLSSTILYYKIRVYDADELSHDTDIVSVSVPKLDDVKIFPNVVVSGDAFQVDLGEQNVEKFRIYNMNGRLIQEIKQNAKIESYTLPLQAGQYAVEFGASQNTETRYLVVQ